MTNAFVIMTICFVIVKNDFYIGIIHKIPDSKPGRPPAGGEAELNLMRSIYGKESVAARRARLAGIQRSRGGAPRCGASPQAIAPSAPPAPNVNIETPGRGETPRLL
jgi:hypothetical protein